jgi:hypothetical protein
VIAALDAALHLAAALLGFAVGLFLYGLTRRLRKLPDPQDYTTRYGALTQEELDRFNETRRSSVR